jgi:hypothetical protein
MDLVGKMLPALPAADVVGFAVQDSSLVFIEEYVGVSAPLVTQAMRVLEALKPSAADLAVLHSVEIACWAPLTRYQHAESLVARGFGDEVVESAMKLGLGAGINHTVASAELNERVIDNPNVWGSASTGVDVATFLPLGLSRPTPGALTAATTARSRRRRPRRPGPRFQTGVCRVCRGGSRPTSLPGWPSFGHPRVRGAPAPSVSPHSRGHPSFCSPLSTRFPSRSSGAGTTDPG